MTTSTTSRFDIFPRTDITYCYICNANIRTERFEGDKDQQRAQGKREAFQNFFDTGKLDIHPITCSSATCMQLWATLPEPKYPDRTVSYRGKVKFDGGSFFGFPSRLGRSEINESNNEVPVNLFYLSEYAEDLEPLFEAWLLFGLLYELSENAFDESNLLDVAEDGSEILSFRRFLETVRSWMPTVSRTTENGKSMFNRLQSALTTVFIMLRAVMNSRFSKELRIFLACTAEVVQTALKALFPEQNWSAWFVLMHPQLAVEDLVRMGWCRSEAKFLSSKPPSLTTQAFLSQLDRRDSRPLHNDCKSTTCLQLAATALHQGEDSHRSDCSIEGCREIELENKSIDAMCSFLQRDTFPVLEINARNPASATVQVHKFEPGMCYIAISHVWAQGLGNKKNNALNLCHLQHVQRLSQDVWNIMFPNQKAPCLVWLDTLCCPVTSRAPEKYRDKALELLRQSYVEASAVLVIDTELEKLDIVKYSPMEIAARIFISSWAHRLWTLQEGCIPIELWIQFQARAINAHSLFLALRNYQRKLKLQDRIVSAEMLGYFLSIRLLSKVYQSENPEQELCMLALAMPDRRVEYDEDEAVCIATLLDLDLSRILVTKDPVERIKLTWLQLSEKGLVPRKIVFCSGKKLNLPGFRWAYSTFLQQPAPLGFQGNVTSKGIFSENGLLIKGEGIIFEIAPPLRGFNAGYCLPVDIPAVHFFAIRLANEQWKRFIVTDTRIDGGEQLWNSHKFRPWTELQQPRKRFALIRKRLSTETESADDGTYLLAEIKAEQEDGILCKWLNIGLLQELTNEESAENSLACLHVEHLRQQEDFKALQTLENQTVDDKTNLEGREMHERLQPHLSFNRTLLERHTIPDSLKEITPGPLFRVRIVTVLAGKYVIACEQRSENQGWYID